LADAEYDDLNVVLQSDPWAAFLVLVDEDYAGILQGLLGF
jgi:hypothetical protein